jgi:hypothetical protein
MPTPSAVVVGAVATGATRLLHFNYRVGSMSWLVVYLVITIAGLIIVFAMFKVGGDADTAIQVARSADRHDEKSGASDFPESTARPPAH